MPATDAVFEFDVAVVGMGYVGLPTSLAFREAGYRVLGLDISDQRLQIIRNGRADLLEGDRNRLDRALGDPAFELTSDSGRLSSAAAVVVAVPTPVDKYLVPDLSILRSACYVGSTRDLLAQPLKERGLFPGTDIQVAFSPERINPGVDDFSQEQVPRVVGGITPACGRRAELLLGKYVPNVHLVPTAEAAEMTKLLENTSRAVNIALANEFADIRGALNPHILVAVVMLCDAVSCSHGQTGLGRAPRSTRFKEILIELRQRFRTDRRAATAGVRAKSAGVRATSDGASNAADHPPHHQPRASGSTSGGAAVMTATRGASPALSAPEPPGASPALSASEPQEQSMTEHELSRGTCRRCAEVQHGGPS